MNDSQKFFQLLKYSNELKKQNKSLENIDYQAFRELLHILAIIETNFHHLERKQYIELIKDLFTGEISVDDFSYSFIAIYEGINNKLSQMSRNESLELENFLAPDRDALGRLLARMYGCCDSFSLDPEISMCDETEVIACAQSLLLKLQEE